MIYKLILYNVEIFWEVHQFKFSKLFYQITVRKEYTKSKNLQQPPPFIWYWRVQVRVIYVTNTALDIWYVPDKIQLNVDAAQVHRATNELHYLHKLRFVILLPV